MMSLSDFAKAVSGKTVLVDSNIIIYLTDSISPLNALSRRLFELIETGEVAGVVSIVSVGEVMQGPLKKGFYQAAVAVKDYLLNFPNLFCESVTTRVLDIIGKDKRIHWSQLRTADSLIVASALKNKVDRIVSNDNHFKKALPKGLLVSFD
ncbi:MAG: type II toxin-antitoxin system VapC family toxin [Desulfobacterales bacterium]